METIHPKAGKMYQLRNGLTTEPLVKDDPKQNNYIYSAKVKDPQYKTPSVIYWKGNGRALLDYIDHKHDIIKEIY